MRVPGRGRLALALVVVAVAVTVAVALAGHRRGIALYAYVLVLAALAVRSFYARLGTALPATPPLGSLLPRHREPETHVRQLQELVFRLSGGDHNAFDLHYRLRPLVREIATARLARHHGLELDSRPELAHTLVGPRTWELVRPERQPPDDVWNARGWSEAEVSELVDELERI